MTELMAVAAAALLALPMISGCANPYRRSYRSYVGDQPPAALPTYLPCDDALEIIDSKDLAGDSKSLMRAGFSPVGVSDFLTGRGTAPDDVRRQAQDLGACRVLVTSKYKGLFSGMYGANARRYWEDRALFFVKQKWRFGAQLTEVPAETARKLGRDGGVFVYVVAQGTPASDAGIREGDVLWSIDDAPVDMQNYGAFLDRPGARLTVELYRDGRRLIKSVSLAK